MSEQPTSQADRSFARGITLLAAGPFGQRMSDRIAEYEKLVVFAESCGFPQAVVDAKLMTMSCQQVFDWIASGEGVPLPNRRI